MTTVLSADTRVPDAIRASLEALPDFAPSERLRERLARDLAGTRVTTPRRWRYLAAAAAIAVVAFGLGRWGAGPDQTTTVASSDASMIGRNRVLEAEVAALRVTHAAMGEPAAGELALARIDHQLQAAYDRGAPLTELESLWRERENTLATLVQTYRRPASAVRI
jgi:hypothetical protein